MNINVEEFLDEIKEFYFHENEIGVKHKEVETKNSYLNTKSVNNRFHRRIGVEFRIYELDKLKITLYKNRHDVQRDFT